MTNQSNKETFGSDNMFDVSFCTFSCIKTMLMLTSFSITDVYTDLIVTF
jgi:hypothetical protein